MEDAGRRVEAERVLESWLLRSHEVDAESPEELVVRHPRLADMLAPMLQEVAAGDAALRAAAAALPEPGAQLDDFRVLREIGRGGMGVVYEAEQTSLGRRVALKILPSALRLDPHAIERFRRDARFAGRLRHPGIVEVYAVGRAGPLDYFAMELVPGASLDRVLARLRQQPGSPAGDHGSIGFPNSAPGTAAYHREAAALIARVADALDHAHREGIIHRDVKPSNILLRHDGPVLTDFGLAQDATLPRVTVTGHALGTPLYASPEQASGDRARVDRRTDIWSLGVTLYELLTLRHPFQGETLASIFRAVQENTPVSPCGLVPGLPRDLDTIVLKALEKEPERRYATVAELAADLRAFLEGRSIRARRVGIPGRAWRLARQHPRLAGLAVAVVLLVLLVAGYELFQTAGRRTARHAAAVASLLEKARALEAGEDPELAFLPVLEALRLGRHPEPPQRVLEASERLVAAGLYGGAEVLLSRLVESDLGPDLSARARLVLAHAAFSRLDVASAIRHATEAAEVRGGPPEVVEQARRAVGLLLGLESATPDLFAAASLQPPPKDLRRVYAIDTDGDGRDELVSVADPPAPSLLWSFADGEVAAEEVVFRDGMDGQIAGTIEWAAPCTDPRGSASSLVTLTEEDGRTRLLSLARRNTAFVWYCSTPLAGPTHSGNVADTDGDGRADLVLVLAYDRRTVWSVPWTVDGFGTPSRLPHSEHPDEDVFGLVAADLDADGRDEVVTATFGHHDFALSRFVATDRGLRKLGDCRAGSLTGCVRLRGAAGSSDRLWVARSFTPFREDLSTVLSPVFRDGGPGMYEVEWGDNDWRIDRLAGFPAAYGHWQELTHPTPVKDACGQIWIGVTGSFRQRVYGAGEVLRYDCALVDPDPSGAGVWSLPGSRSLITAELDGDPAEEIVLTHGKTLGVLGLSVQDGGGGRWALALGSPGRHHDDAVRALAHLAVSLTDHASDITDAAREAVRKLLACSRFDLARSVLATWMGDDSGSPDSRALVADVDFLAGHYADAAASLRETGAAPERVRLAEALADPSGGRLLGKEDFEAEDQDSWWIRPNVPGGAHRATDPEGLRGGRYGRGAFARIPLELGLPLPEGGVDRARQILLASNAFWWDGDDPLRLRLLLQVGRLDFGASFEAALVPDEPRPRVDGPLWASRADQLQFLVRLLHQRDTTKAEGDRYEAALLPGTAATGTDTTYTSPFATSFSTAEWLRLEVEWLPDHGVGHASLRRIDHPPEDPDVARLHAVGIRPELRPGAPGSYRLLIQLTAPEPGSVAEVLLDEIEIRSF